MTHHPLGQLPELSPRNIGSAERAVSLLRRSGDRVPVPHAAAGMQALADLFAAHPPKRRLRRRAA